LKTNKATLASSGGGNVDDAFEVTGSAKQGKTSKPAPLKRLPPRFVVTMDPLPAETPLMSKIQARFILITGRKALFITFHLTILEPSAHMPHSLSHQRQSG